MKLPALAYASPRSVDEVVALLEHHDGDARIIAGGQSLMPMLAFRLAAPGILVDLRNVPGLDGIEVGPTGTTVGARVTWRDLEKSAAFAAAQPLVAAALPEIAHYQIRNRGTVGGSLAHADPAAELPALALCCDAEIVARGPNGTRVIPAQDLFAGALMTTLGPAELIVAIRFPAWPAARRFGFREFARRRGDFAIAGIALHYNLDQAARISHARIAAFGVADTPIRLRAAEAALLGQAPDASLDARAAEAAMASVDPQTDLHADGRYRRSLVGTLLVRALEDARSRTP